MKSLTRLVTESAIWMVLLRFTIRALGLASTVVLARLLNPSDFGLVAMATLVLGVIEIMAQFGFDAFLIRRESLDKAYYSTIWTLCIARGALLCLILLCLAGPSADFFAEPRLENLIYVLAASAFVESFQNVFIVEYQRTFNFRFEFLFQVVKKLVMIATSITLAVLYETYWALMAGIVVSRVFGVAFSYVLARERPTLSLSKLGEAFSFSKWMLLTHIAIYARNHADQLLIGRMLAPGALGSYLVAKEISELPTTELVHPIQRALLPGFSRLASDRQAMRAAYLRTFSTILQIGAPLGVGLALVAEPLVKCMLGAKWLAAIPVLQILAIHGAIRVGYTSAGAVYLAIGRPQIDGILALVALLLGAPALWFGIAQYELQGAAYATVATTVVSVLMHLAVTARILSLTLRDVLAVIWRSLAALALMCIVVTAIQQHVSWASEGPRVWIELIVLSAAGGITYVAAVIALWALSGFPNSAEREVLNLINLGPFRK